MRSTSITKFVWLSGLIFLVSPTAFGADASTWPKFRGPDGTGYVSQGMLPNGWDSADYRWTIELPGGGVGSPAIADGVIYLLAAIPAEDSRVAMALDATTGKTIWSKRFPLRSHHLHSRNTFASSTPCVDEHGIYFTWGDPDQVTVVALSRDGEELWQRDLGSWQSQHGFGGSPVMLDGKLMIFNSQQAEQLRPGQKPGESKMVALDPKTGDTIWQTSLQATRACYGVPVLRKSPGGKQEIIAANTGNGLFALDAETGRMLWSLPVFSARSVSSPLLVGDLVIGSAGSGGGGNHLVAVRPPTDASNQSQATEVYRMESNAPYVPTPAIVGTRLFMVDDRGIASCVDGLTGESIWTKRVGGNYGASPIVIGDKVLLISLDGKATVLRASDKYERLAAFELGGPVQATPAVADGSMILRIGNQLCSLSITTD